MIDCRYPDIVLHDSVIDRVEYDKRSVCLTFENNNEFWVKKKDKYCMATNSSLTFYLQEEDSFLVSIVQYIPILNKWLWIRHKDMELNTLLRSVNKKKWRMTIIKEFYGVNSCYIILFVKKGLYCHFDIRFDKVHYLCDEQ